MRTKAFFAISLALLIQSCIPSLYPLYTEETIVFEPALLGAWKEEDSLWRFEQGQNNLFRKDKDKMYRLTHLDLEKKEKTTFDVHLIKLGDHYFFDFYTLADDLALPDIQSIAPLVPTHGFAKVAFDKKTMKLSFFDYEWLEKLFEQRNIRLRHEKASDGTILLTAPTGELQKFVLKYAEEENAFLEPSVLKKEGE